MICASINYVAHFGDYHGWYMWALGSTHLSGMSKVCDTGLVQNDLPNWNGNGLLSHVSHIPYAQQEYHGYHLRRSD